MKNVGEYPNKIWDLALLKAVTSNNSEKHFEKKNLYGVQKKGVICFYSRE